jgi:hypothetical protein
MITVEHIEEKKMFIITVVDGGNSTLFVVDGREPEAIHDRNGNLVGYTTLPEHALLYEDFQNEDNLIRFVDLLSSDSMTAYSTYLQTR